MFVIGVILLAVLVLVIVKPTTPSSRDLLIAVGAALVFMSLFVSAVLFTPMVDYVDNSDDCGGVPCALVILLIIGLWVSALLGVIGLLCAPLVALTCYILAARRDLDALRYAVAGAMSSALLLLPGIYLVVRLRDISVPRVIVAAAYVIVYTFWLFWLCGYIAVIVSEIVPYHIYLDHIFLYEGTGEGTDAATDAVLVLWFVITGLFFLALVSSLLRLYRGHRTGQRSVHRGFVPAGVYLHPFLLLPWMIALPVTLVITLGTVPL